MLAENHIFQHMVGTSGSYNTKEERELQITELSSALDDDVCLTWKSLT